MSLAKFVIGAAIVAASFWVTLSVLDYASSDGEPQNERRTAANVGFDDTLYLAVNPDVAAAISGGKFRSAQQHYDLAGRSERRAGAYVPQDWNEAQYLKMNPDVAAAVADKRFVNGYHHFLVSEKAEKRVGGFPPGRAP